MTVEEFTMSYFTLGSKIDWLVVYQPDGEGGTALVYNGYIGSIIYMHPAVRKATITTWRVDTKLKKIYATITPGKIDLSKVQ